MRNTAVVILWVVAAASLFLSPAKAETESEEEIPPTTEPSLVDVESDPDNSTTLSIVLGQFSGSDVDSQSDAGPETDVDHDADVVPVSDVVLHSADEEEEEEEDYYVDQEGEGEDSVYYERGIGCKPKKSCLKKDGTCRTSCKKKEKEFKKGKCKGKCVCCLRKVKHCKQKGPCVGQGTCRSKCHDDETPASYLPCKGSKCTCCIAKSGQGVCSTSPECVKLRGTCKAACSGEKVVVGLCSGPHCTCCVPPASCPNTDSCKHNGGTCRSECEDTEVRLPGTCNLGCFCCGPEPTDCTQTPICPGTCAQMCTGVVSLEANCLGDSCLCCLDCSPTQSCIDAHGKCKSVCGCGEKELANGCNGGGCKCCVADIPPCEMKQSGCDSCMYTPLCTGNAPAEFCKSGGPGCSCCPL